MTKLGGSPPPHFTRGAGGVAATPGEVRFQVPVDDDSDNGGTEGGGLLNQPPEQESTDARRAPAQRDKRLRVEFVGMEDLESQKKDVDADLRRLSTKGAGSDRYNRPRMSLLGKPLNYRAHKRDARYRRLQARIYNFLERPKDWRAISYHLVV